MPLLSTFGAASARGFGNLSGIILPSDSLWNTVSFLSHFEGTNNGVNNAFDDGSASNHTITAAGNVTQGSFGPFARPDGEWAVSFDGQDYSYIDINDGVTFGSGDFTIEMFANFSSVAANSILFDGRPTSTSGDYPIIIHDSAAGGLQYNVGGTAITGGTIVANTWYHIALCRSSSSTKMFLDGTQIGSTYSDSTTYVDSGRMRLGASGYSGTAILQGSLSNVRVVNSALYTSNFTAPTSALTAVTNTKLLTCQSNRFVDNSASPLTVTPNSNTTTVGSPAVSAFGPFLTTSVYDPAVNAASAYFNNSSGTWLTAATSSDFDLGTGDFTIECWINNNATGEFGIVGDMAGNGATDSYCMWWNNSVNQIRFGTAGLANMIGWGITQTLNAWNHIAVIRSSGAIKFFYNGTEVTVRAVDSGDLDGATFNAPTPMYIGAFNDGSARMKGYMSDVRVVKGTAVYTGNFTPPTAPLTAITNTTLLLNMADGQAIDSAAQNNLRLYGNAKISSTQSKFGGTSMVFDGTGDYAHTTLSTPIGTGDYTLECFVRFNAVAYKGVFQLDATPLSGNAYKGPLVFVYEQSGFFWSTMTQSGSDQVLISSTTPSTNTWYHVANVRTNGVVKIFIDGTQIIDNFTDTSDYSAHTSLVVGGFFTTDYLMNGYIDEFRISNTARYTSNFTAPSEPFADKGQ